MKNEGTVRILLPESIAINLLGLLGHGLTSEACDDLGLGQLYADLANGLGRTNFEGTNGQLIGRGSPNVPITVRLRDEVPLYISIDLT